MSIWKKIGMALLSLALGAFAVLIFSVALAHTNRMAQERKAAAPRSGYAFPRSTTDAEAYSGLTRRQLYAAMVMEGLCAGGISHDPLVMRNDTTFAWKCADALIATENE